MRLRNGFVAVCVLLLSGCGKDPELDSGPAAGGREPERPVSLTLWHIMNYSGPREVLAAAARRFEAAYPDTSVNIQTFANDAYKTKLAIEMASGNPPDVFFTWGGGPLAAFAASGQALDLTAALAVDGWGARFLPAALRICSVDERAYAVPLDLSCVVLWLNRDLFRSSGLEPPRTFAELLALCRQFRAQGVTPLALGNMKQWPGAFYFVYLAAREGGAPLFFEAAARRPGSQFDDPAFVRAGDRLRELVDVRAFSTGSNGIEDGQARTQFLNGRAAMYLMGTWLVARIRTEKPEFLESLDCVPFPTTATGSGAADTVVGGVNCGFAVAGACRYPERAVALLRFLTDAETAAEWCRIGRIPALAVPESALSELPAPTRAARNLLDRAAVLQPYYDQYLAPRLAEVHKNTTQELFAGTLSPAEAAAAMEQCARTASNE